MIKKLLKLEANVKDMALTVYLDHHDPQTIQIVVDLLEQVQGLQGVLPTTLVCNGWTEWNKNKQETPSYFAVC
jgi:hypothetical protein